MPEHIYIPESADIPASWTSADSYLFGYVYVEFPSGSVSGLTRMISIDVKTRLMTCNCPGFKFKGVCSHVKKLRWICKKRGRTTKAVSLEARLRQEGEKMEGDFRKILNALKEHPATSYELQTKLVMLHQTCSARISNLYKSGWIEPTGDERPTGSGSMAIVWQIS